VYPAAGDHIFLSATGFVAMPDHPEVVSEQPRPLAIFHPETGQVETIPATRAWNPPVSPDGKWLVVVGNDGGASQREVLKLRPFEDPGAESRNLLYASGSSSTTIPSPDWSYFATEGVEPGSVEVVTFPDGMVVGRWSLPGYELGQLFWAPSGRSLAVSGYRYGPDVRGRGNTVVAESLHLIDVPAAPSLGLDAVPQAP
jgi:hypothetical protein